MTERPLLLFPIPKTASRSTLGGGAGRPHLPTHHRQGQRLAPKFTQLEEAVRARNIEIQQTIPGIDPEQVLVLETIGSVEDFANAVKKIPDLEWMGEFDLDEIAPDEDFYDEKHPEKELSGRLFLVLTNQRALDEMLSLWRRYQKDPGMRFERGFAKFGDVFLRLKDIRRWGVRDRLEETGVLDAWRADLEHEGDRPIRFEVEVWFRRSEEKRERGATIVSTLIQQLGGQVLSTSIHKGIAYHGILAELPANAIQAIVDDPNTALVKCDNIMFFRPVGQMVAGDGPLEEEHLDAEPEARPLPSGAPVIAMLDGLPLANHRLLNGRLFIDDPDGVEADYPAAERVHGTSMASLIVQGDLNDGQQPLGRPVYVRPIMQPMENDSRTPRREHVPDDVLFVDLIHRSVKRLFEGDGREGPVAPTVRVINLSIGDPYRPFLHSMSPVAKLLDWLSHTYGVLFVVSAGNHSDALHLGVSRREFEASSPAEQEAAVVKSLFADARNRKLLSPAESINGLTVGAIQYDSAQFEPVGNRFNPFLHDLPSLVSAFGSGYRRSIKPDCVFPGGRMLYQEDLGSSRQDNYVIAPVPPSIRSIPPGNQTAIPGKQPGSLDGVAYSSGTSNAAALTSRAAGVCYDALQQILAEQAADMDTRAFDAPLLKAMLVHGCAWGDVGPKIADLLRTKENKRQISGLISRWMGYGVPQVDRVLDCTEQRATLLGFGQLSDGKAHVFRLPLPPSLGARPEWRRLTVTMAWLSPISAGTQKYRTASLWFEVGGISLAKDRQEASSTDGWRAVRRGTLQHEVFEGQKAEPFSDGDVIEIKVNCREDAGKLKKSVAYGLAVSLEVAEGVDVAVYDEIRTRIVVPEPAPAPAP
uniref:Subtilase family protein n=1 Tax=Candidatus Kentrum sp. LFY TaxID=2126342 RepID=A0A450V9H4_9GAMM|nr:MAG: Subtilase family protein [Candidatus Kentron sp. LFY]